jgi:hypothetical protein
MNQEITTEPSLAVEAVFRTFRCKIMNYSMALLNFFLFLSLGSAYIHKSNFIVGGTFIAISGGMFLFFFLPVLVCGMIIYKFHSSLFGLRSGGNNYLRGVLSVTTESIVWFAVSAIWLIFTVSGINSLIYHHYTSAGILLFLSQLSMSIFFLPLCIYSHHNIQD